MSLISRAELGLSLEPRTTYEFPTGQEETMLGLHPVALPAALGGSWNRNGAMELLRLKQVYTSNAGVTAPALLLTSRMTEQIGNNEFPSFALK